MTTMLRAHSDQTATARPAAARFAASNAVTERFFTAHADAIAQACQAMAGRFQRGGRLLVCGDGAQRSDVAHVVVEFVHPVVVGKRALPALPLPAIAGGEARRALDVLGRPGDMLLALALAATAADDGLRSLLAGARANGMLTLALTGPASGQAPRADHTFAVLSPDPCIVQETHELLYHVLWELVHVFFEHRAVSG